MDWPRITHDLAGIMDRPRQLMRAPLQTLISAKEVSLPTHFRPVRGRRRNGARNIVPPDVIAVRKESRLPSRWGDREFPMASPKLRTPLHTLIADKDSPKWPGAIPKRELSTFIVKILKILNVFGIGEL